MRSGVPVGPVGSTSMGLLTPSLHHIGNGRSAHHWRPVSAIRLAYTAHNRRTKADPDWLPLAPTPPYSDHSSGYNCLTGAFVNTGKAFFGTDRISFTVHSNATNADRSYKRLTDPVKDTIDARVWVGIHFRKADVAGAELGRNVALWVDKHFFQPLSCGDDRHDD
jgi:hypothetical protein